MYYWMDSVLVLPQCDLAKSCYVTQKDIGLAIKATDSGVFTDIFINIINVILHYYIAR